MAVGAWCAVWSSLTRDGCVVWAPPQDPALKGTLNVLNAAKKGALLQRGW